MHASLPAALHTSTDGNDFISAGMDNSDHYSGDGENANCSGCHTLSMLPLHANNCGMCHASSASVAVKTAVTNHQTGCTACHPGPHYGGIGAHEDEYNSGNYDCGSCHGHGCYGCHSAWTPVPEPHTTSDAVTSYIGGAVINLSATDNVRGSFGIKQTYYTLDSGPQMTGTAVSVAAPGELAAQDHTLRFWSTDWSGNIEVAHVATFTVSHDSVAPVTSSDATSSYGTTATIHLTATDDSRDFGVKNTYFRLDGGATTTGTVATAPRTPSGTTTHTLEFWSVDYAGNRETTKSATFGITRDTVAPTTTDSLPRWTRSSYVWMNFYAVDPAPASGVASVSVVSLDADTIYWQAYGSPTYGVYAGFSSQGIHSVRYYSVDNEGNTEASKVATFGLDWTAPTTTSDALTSYTGTATVRMTPTDALSGVAQTYWRTYRSATWSAWYPGTVATITPPASGSVSVTLYYYSTDVAGNTGSQIGKTFTITAPASDVTPPAGTMSVNNGSAYATSTAATVNSAMTDSGSGMYQMRIDPGTGTYGGWIAYAASSAIVMPAGDGVKTVNAQYKDNAGNIATKTDTIVLDTTAPNGTMVINNDAATTATTAVTVNAAMTDALSGVYQMSVDPGTGTYGPWVAYAASQAIVLPPGSGLKTVNVQYKDNAGNTVTKTDTITLTTPVDTTPPTTTSNAQATYTNTAVITLTASDNAGGSGVKATYYRLDGGAQTAGTVITTSAPGSSQPGVLVRRQQRQCRDSACLRVVLHREATALDFGFTGSDQSFTVPAGVTALTVDLYGAQGGSDSYNGGLGGHVHATVPVTPGQVLTVRVGGTGNGYAGGWPNGGNAGHGARRRRLDVAALGRVRLGRGGRRRRRLVRRR